MINSNALDMEEEKEKGVGGDFQISGINLDVPYQRLEY